MPSQSLRARRWLLPAVISGLVVAGASYVMAGASHLTDGWLPSRIWQALAAALVFFITLASIFSAATNCTTVGEHRWISVAPLFAALAAATGTLLMLAQLEHIAALIGRLAQFAGVAETLALNHATGFIAMVIALTARALYVILEMDNGRYAGAEDLPCAIAQNWKLRCAETLLRLLIIACLTTFVGAFVRVVVPFTGSHVSMAGTAVVLADLSQDCHEYGRVLESIGHGQDSQSCLRDGVAGLSRDELVRRAQPLVGPMPLLLGTAYGAMLAWCIIVWRWGLGRCADPGRIRAALILQLIIPVVALLNLVVMVTWVGVAEYGLPATLPQEKDGALVVLSGVGIVLTILIFGLLTFRFTADVQSLGGASRRLRESLRPISGRKAPVA